MLENTREWKIGRRGEILTTAIWAEYGFTILDVSSTGAASRAPLLHQAETNIVAPDHLMMRRASFWMDTKTKAAPFEWRGGGLEHAEAVAPAGQMHGIQRRSLVEYRRVQQQTRKPVVICVLCILTADLRANTLQGLGEPYLSVSPAFDIVNWPIDKLRVICEFDPRRLKRYFFDEDGEPRPPPPAMPPPHKMRAVVDWLRPRQGEIEHFRHDLLARLEQLWGDET